MRVSILCLLVGVASLLAHTPTSAQTDRALNPWASRGSLTLTTEYFGPLPRCDLRVTYEQSNSTGGLALVCTRFKNTRPEDLVASRKLSAAEVNAVAKLVVASDLYSGGHVGQFRGMHGPFERLEVLRCCGRSETVVLITTGNPSFAEGNRRALLNLLNEWKKPLRDEVQRQRSAPIQ